MEREPAGGARRRVSDEDYQALAAYRHALRRFLAFSERAARDSGLTAQQHQAILAIRGQPAGERMTVGDLAENLLIRHHSAVELVDRLAKGDLVTRAEAEDDRRRVVLSLTPKAEVLLEALSARHLEELGQAKAMIIGLLDRLGEP